jgi:hypothetical protein
LYHAKNYPGEFFRRMKFRLGTPQAITATAHNRQLRPQPPRDPYPFAKWRKIAIALTTAQPSLPRTVCRQLLPREFLLFVSDLSGRNLPRAAHRAQISMFSLINPPEVGFRSTTHNRSQS